MLIKHKKNILKTLLSIICISLYSYALAAPDLYLKSDGGMAGSSFEVTLNIYDSEINSNNVAGINAHLNLPPGVILESINSGTVLQSKNFIINHSIDGDNLYLIIYSANDVIDQNGEILKFNFTMPQINPIQDL